MNKSRFYAGVLPVLLLLLKVPALAQSLPVGTPVIEDAYRRMQLMGKIDSNVSFTIRPIFPASAFNNENIFDPDHSLTENGSINSYRTHDGNGILRMLPVTWQQQYNSHNPYGWNDGAMIPAAGYQTMMTTGLYAKYNFFSIQLQPEFVFAQNKNFDGFTQAGNDATAWKAWYKLYNTTDLPERFGTTPYTKVLPGQSSVRLTWEPVSLGLSTENLWWGPGIRNSLVMSNTATGFAHLTLNTTRPVQTPIGSFEAQVISGRLTGSGYAPLVPGQAANHDTLYTPKPNDWRYLSGGVFTYQPKWVPGLFVGITRVFQVYHNDMGHGLSDYFPVFLSFLKKSYYNPATGVNLADASNQDQLASIFARWLWPAANAEIYAEYGREDHNWDTRDLLLDPEHSRAYIIGFRKLFAVADDADQRIQVGVEETQLAKPADDLINRNTTPDWYANNQVTAGYTNNGEVLGAGIGPGSTLQTLNVSWFSGLKQIGLQVERYEHNEDLYDKAFSAGEVRRHWVDYSVGINGDWDYGHFIFSASLLYVRELNYQWKFQDDPNLFYFNQPRFDANNFKPSISVSYRF